MDTFEGKVAVVTGGGSGIGRALCYRFAQEGMAVVAADIDQAGAEATVEAVRKNGGKGLAVRADVTKLPSMQEVADRAYETFGAVHILCNNAGVSPFGRLQDMTEKDWHWVLSVNLDGVVHGLLAFLPRMIAQRSGGHIVNTASIAGLFTMGGQVGAYAVSKFGVVALSEGLRHDLEPEGIGVSVLCPGGVRTEIVRSGRNRPAELGDAPPPPRQIEEAIDRAIDPAVVADLVLDGIRSDELYILTETGTRAAVEARFAGLLAAYDRLAARQQ